MFFLRQFFLITPNSANSQLTVAYISKDIKTNRITTLGIESLQRTDIKQFEIEFYDDREKKIIYQNNKLGNKDITIKTQNLPNGTYFLHIIVGKETIKKQIIIQH